MKKTWMSRIRRKVSAVLVCSMLMMQVSAVTPGVASAASASGGSEAAETVTLRGRIVSLAGGYDVTKDMDLRLYINGRPDTSHRPVFVKAEDSREPFDLYDDSFDLINDLDGGIDRAGTASASDLEYDVWEYRFEELPFEDADGNEYEYTIRDAARGTATSSNMASGSNLATDSRTVREQDALYWTDMEGTEILGVNCVEFPAAGTRLVYVPYTDVEGAYAFAGAEDRDPEQVTLEAGCVLEADEDFLESCGDNTLGAGRDGEPEVLLDVDDGSWSVERVPQYNPLTCAAVEYRIKAVSGYEDYQIRYENRGNYAGEKDYACAGGTIYHEPAIPEPLVTYSVTGVVAWNDQNDLWGLRPDSADFLRVYDESGEDVTAQTTIRTEGTDTDTWTCTIEGLTAGERYLLGQNLPAYDAEGLDEIILADGEQMPIRQNLRTGSVRGLIHISSRNPLVKEADFRDILHVYAASEEVTDRVELELNRSDGIHEAGEYMAYMVNGLPEGRTFTIRADKPEGYAVIPSEVAVTAGGSYDLRSRLSAELPGMFTLRAETSAELTIDNVYFEGQGGGENGIFTYELKMGDTASSLGLYKGPYKLITDKQTGRSEDWTTDDGTIRLSENQQAVIPMTVGETYSVTQKKEEQDKEFALLYGGENTRTKQISKDQTENFTNIKYQLKQYKKRWNDNGNQNGTGTRPSADKLQAHLKLTVTRTDGSPLTSVETDKLGLNNPAVRINTGLGANEWAIVYEKMPVADKEGNALSYDLTEAPVDGYRTTYTEDTVYEKVIVNTSYMTFDATILWLDSTNETLRFTSAETFKDHLELYRADPAGGLDEPVIFGAAENSITVKGEADSLFWDVKIGNLVEYDDQGLPYIYYLKEKTDPDGTIKTNDQKAWYVSTCTNLVNYFNEKEKCYDGGYITNLLQGQTDVAFTKLWKDGNADITETPNLTFQLMRYPSSLDPVKGYAQASSVETKTAADLGPEGKKIEGRIIWGDKIEGQDEITATIFPRFDANGEEYVYFVRELLSGTNSGEYVQKITSADGGKSFFADSGLALVANGETVTNKREGKISLPVTKTWKSAAYQNIDAKVELKVMRRSQNPQNTGWQTMKPEYFEGGAYPVITGFSAETLTMGTTVGNLFKYDDDGYLYEYEVSENRIWLRTDKTKAAHPENEDAQYVELAKEEGKDAGGDITSLVFKTTQGHFDGNLQYRFREKTESDGGTGWKITNTLENDIQIRVDKYWEGDWRKVKPDAYPVKLTFELFRDDSALAEETLEKPEINPLIDGKIQTIPFLNPERDNENQWPRYDENGKEYVYTIKETVEAKGSVGRITYRYNWKLGEWASTNVAESDKEDDTWVTKVSNPPPGKGAGIEIEKIWLDGGDLPHREPVEVTLYEKESDGSWKKTEKKTVLTEEDGWKGYIAITDKADAIEHPEAYMVVETALGTGSEKHSHEVAYDGSGDFIKEESEKYIASGTVENEYHTYTVTSSYSAGKCTITNLRTGVVDVTVTKEWKDGVAEVSTTETGDVTNGHRPENATFQLLQNDKPYSSDAASNAEAAGNTDATGYSDAAGNNENPQTTTTNKSQTKEHDTPLIQWRNLPKYDEKGELYLYTVEETRIGDKKVNSGGADFTDHLDDGTEVVHQYTASIVTAPYEHSSIDPDTGEKTNDRIAFHAVNQRSQGRTIRIYKYWKDDGSNTSPRADVYFSLMRSVDGGANLEPAAEAGKAIKNDNYVLPAGHEDQKDNWFEFVFDSAPRYDGDGREYTYYLSEGMNGNSSRYKPYYYDETPEKIGPETTPLEGISKDEISWYPMPHDTATVVNIREDSVKVTGKKIWDNMGGLKQENGDFPKLKLELQVKPLHDNTALYTDVLERPGEAGSVYTCTLPDKTYSYEYQFNGPEQDRGFPKYDEVTGQELTYHVAEKTIDGQNLEELGYYKRTSDKKSFVIKNTYTGETSCQVKLVKSWVDVPADIKTGQDKEGPTITVELWRVMTKLDDDGKAAPIPYTAEKVESKTVKYSEAIGEKNTVNFEYLAKTAPTMQPYQYYLKETKLNGYQSSLTGSEDDTGMWVTPEDECFTLDQTSAVEKKIVNTYVPSTEEVTEIKGQKAWVYTGHQDKLTLKAQARIGIEMELYRQYVNSVTGGNVEEKVDAEFAWTDPSGSTDTSAPWEFHFTPKNPAAGFPKYAPNGTEYSYFVRETITDENLEKLFGTGSDSNALTVSAMNGENNLLTVTNKLQTVELEAKKSWDDVGNLYGTRPKNITLTVERKPVNVEDIPQNWLEYQAGENTVTMTISGDMTAEHWTMSMKDLPKYDYVGDAFDVQEYIYRAVENEVDVPAGYKHLAVEDSHVQTNDICISEIGNVLQTDWADITAEKIWLDHNDMDGLRSKTEVYVELWRKAESADNETGIKVDSVLLLASPSDAEKAPKNGVIRGKNTVTWNRLPTYMPGNETNRAVYFIKEKMSGDGAPFYQTRIVDPTDPEATLENWQIMNTHPQITDIQVQFTKKWNDQRNRWNTRPETVSVVLLRKAGPGGTEEVAYNIPPDGGEAMEQVKILRASDSEDVAESWSPVTFKNLPYAQNGIPYIYYVREGTVKNGAFVPETKGGYKLFAEGDGTEFKPEITSDKAGHEGSVTLINNLETTSVQAEKVWDDFNNRYDTRPDSVTFKLYCKTVDTKTAGQGTYREVVESQAAPIVITKEGFEGGEATIGNANFRLKYDDLPKTNTAGKPYAYQIRETSMAFEDKVYQVSWNEEGTSSTGVVGGYTISAKSENGILTISNTLFASAPIQVKKQWNDQNDQDGIRETKPSNIKVTLYQTLNQSETEPSRMVSMGEKSLAEQIGASGTGTPWFAEWKNLPMQSPEGKPYYYRAVETLLEDSAYTVSYEPGTGVAGEAAKDQEHAVTITMINTCMPRTMKVTALKKWMGDDDGILSQRPDTVQLGLYQKTTADTKPVPVKDQAGNPLRKTVGASEQWTAEWSGLPVCSGKGEKITYYVKEESAISGYTSSYGNGNAGATDGTGFETAGVKGDMGADSDTGANAQTITITNTWDTRTIYARKTWEDEANRDGLRKDITLRLLVDGSPAVGQQDKLVKKNAEGLVFWSGLPVKDDEGKQITYTVSEVIVPDGYTASYTGSTSDPGTAPNNGASKDTPLHVTNTHHPAKTAYTIEKLWLGDDEWKEEVRPDSIQVQLYMLEADNTDGQAGTEKVVGAPVTLTADADGRWTYTWTDLYKYQNEGQEIRYYARELGVDGYISTATGSNAESGMIANRMNTTSLKVSKEWEDGGDEYGMRPDTIKILLQRKLKNATAWETLPESKAVFVMNSADGWGMVEFTGLPTHNKKNQPYEYRAVEAEIGGNRTDHGRTAGYEAVYEHHTNLLTVPGETKITNRLVSGSLEVSKTLKSGAAADFSFQVELTVNGTKNGVRTFTKAITVRSGESFRIDGIPAGATYTVTELETSGYSLDSKTGDEGVVMEDVIARAEFVNRKKSSGGGGGGGGHNTPHDSTSPTAPTGSAGPGVPTEPAGPPAEEMPPESETPMESTTLTPTSPELPDIPMTPDRRPDVPKGTTVEVRDPGDPDGAPLYRGSYTGGFKDVPSGRYLLVTLDEEGVPLANMIIFIDDGGVPLALPKTGDTGIPIALLAAALIGSAAGLVLLGRRRREEEE